MYYWLLIQRIKLRLQMKKGLTEERPKEMEAGDKAIDAAKSMLPCLSLLNEEERLKAIRMLAEAALPACDVALQAWRRTWAATQSISSAL